jgi:ribosomal protein S18 acetylase RimI-like enzyme
MTATFIRTASEADLAALTQLRNDAHAKTMTQGDYAWGERTWTEADVKINLSRSFLRKDAYIVEQDGEPVASFSLCLDGERSDITTWGPHDPLAAYVHRICVKEGFNGLGLGSYVSIGAPAM